LTAAEREAKGVYLHDWKQVLMCCIVCVRALEITQPVCNTLAEKEARPNLSRCHCGAASRVQLAAPCPAARTRIPSGTSWLPDAGDQRRRKVSAHAFAPPFFTHLTNLYRRHFEFHELTDELTETTRNAALRSELTQFVEHYMAASGRCAQFDCVLLRIAKSCNSLSLNRYSQITAHTSHLLTHLQDRLCSHRLQARKWQRAGASCFFFACVHFFYFTFTGDFIGSKFAARQYASCSHSEFQNVRNFVVYL
jgi:hypothetical protein